LRIGSYRVLLNVGDEAAIVREMRLNEVGAALGVEDADARCNRAKSGPILRITQ